MTALSPDHSTLQADPAPPGRTPTRTGVRRALTRRWPTVLALVSGAAIVAGNTSDEAVGGLAETLIFLPLLYLVVSTLRRPAVTWLVLIAGVPVTAGLEALVGVDLAVVLLAAALAATVWGGAHSRFGDGSWFTVQVIGMAAFAAVAVAAMSVDPTASRYLVAAGWFAHGVWDFVHLRSGRVVARSYAEWCGVVDVLVAVQLVTLPLLP